jgi:hypothetical protein
MCLVDDDPVRQAGSAAPVVQSLKQFSRIFGSLFFAEQGEVHDQASALLPQHLGHAPDGRKRPASSESRNLMQVSEGRMIPFRVEDAHRVVELDQALREQARGIGLSDTAVSCEQDVHLGRRHPDSATTVRPPERNLPATRNG